MKSANTTSKKLVGGLVAVVLGLCSISAARAQIITINFDSIDTSGGPVVGQPVVDYLATYGISVTANPSSVLPVVATSR